MSTGPSTRRGSNWFAIIALVLVCTILGSLGGTLAGGAAGYFLGRRAARHEVAQATPAARVLPAPDSQPRQIVPPQGSDEEWPWQVPLPGVNAWAQVASVAAGAPAEQAGIKAGDQITAVDGKALTLRRDLAQAIRSHKAGDQVELTLARDGEEMKVQVTLGENPDKAGVPYLGLTYSMAAGAAGRFPSS
ncbi:MAG TPA: PDZ domain-containing protein [Anaerolineae bacterium]|nr:PDZ domain-containing protein [Anaerolineae bacterium]HOQ99750.1 PDZ domain-containing protein [Anaerolineae bacterium]HPL30365.1 PDZ domain-containing protein [Anaerolineae bacterium]